MKLLVLFAVLLLFVPACRQSAPASHAARGVVKSIAPDRGSATIDHERIESLDMEAMTMDFKMRDSGVLTGIKPGDRVDFTIETGSGGAVVTAMKAASR